MPRAPRNEEPGAVFHVTIHSIDEGRIVWTDRDRASLVEAIGITVRRHNWICLACSILDTHFHLLVLTPEPNLAQGMQFLNGTYAQQFNRRHGRRGHLFRERFRSKRVVTDAHLLLTVRYIALNAVEAGIVSHPREHRWSSYPGVVGTTPCWPFIARRELLAYFSNTRSAQRLLVEFVETGPDPDSTDSAGHAA